MRGWNMVGSMSLRITSTSDLDSVLDVLLVIFTQPLGCYSSIERLAYISGRDRNLCNKMFTSSWIVRDTPNEDGYTEQGDDTFDQLSESK